MSLDAFLKRSMHTAITRIASPTRFLLDRFFGRETTFATPFVDIDMVMPKRGMAPFVHPSLAGKVTAGQGFVMKTYTPPTQKPNKLITPELLATRRPGATIYDAGPDVQIAIAELIGEKTAEIQDELAFRREWMAAQALFSGGIPVVGEGYNHTIGYDLPGNHNVTLLNDARWGQSGMSPWEDLRTACRNNRDDGLVVSDTAVFGSDAWGLFLTWLQREENKIYMDMVRANFGQIQPTAVDKYTTYLGSIRDADMSLDLFTYSAQYLSDAGVMTPYVPADEVFIGSTQATGNQVLYGGIQSLAAGTFKTTLFMDFEQKKNPESIELLPQSKPLVTLLEPKAGTKIKVK